MPVASIRLVHSQPMAGGQSGTESIGTLYVDSSKAIRAWSRRWQLGFKVHLIFTGTEVPPPVQTSSLVTMVLRSRILFPSTVSTMKPTARTTTTAGTTTTVGTVDGKVKAPTLR